MVKPVSVDVQFRRLDKHLRDLKQARSSPASDEDSIIVAEICNACALLLDKAMNAVWSSKANKNNGKGKPNIYFPICQSREKLAQKFQQYQLPEMENDDPEIFDLIDSVQSYNQVKWLAALHKLAGIRHEDYPRVEKRTSTGIGIGRGQDLYIQSLTTDGSGNISFKGHGINRESRKIEPAIFEVKREVRSILEGVGEEPYQFCSSSVAEVKRLTSKLYSLI
jgi:hypothetical protein